MSLNTARLKCRSMAVVFCQPQGHLVMNELGLAHRGLTNRRGETRGFRGSGTQSLLQGLQCTDEKGWGRNGQRGRHSHCVGVSLQGARERSVPTSFLAHIVSQSGDGEVGLSYAYFVLDGVQ